MLRPRFEAAMQSILPPDSHHVNAALGWLELGNPSEADAELAKVAPGLRSHPAVLELRWQIYAKAEKWDAAVDVATALIAALPDHAGGWLNYAYALRRAVGGGLRPAQ